SLPRPEAILAWGETREVAAWRGAIRTRRHWPCGERPGGVPGGASRDQAHTREALPETVPAELPEVLPEDLIGRLWALPADAGAAWRCNDRRFCIPIQEALGCRLPGAALIASLGELRAHLAAIELDRDQGWVVKAPFSASGRLRVRRRGRDLEP